MSHYDEIWNERFASLKAYHREHGHCRVTQREDKELGLWVISQRRLYRNKVAGKTPGISDERVRRLKRIGFEFNPSCKRNARNLQVRRRSVESCISGSSEADTSVGESTGKRRASSHIASSRGSAETPMRGLGEMRDEAWDCMYAALLEYRNKHGNTNVPLGYVHEGKPLGFWAHIQRNNHHNGFSGKKPTLPKRRCDKLESAGFDFETEVDVSKLSNDHIWDDMYYALSFFKDDYGHLRVPKDYYHGGKSMQCWIQNQTTHNRNRVLGRKPALKQERADKLICMGLLKNESKGAAASSEVHQRSTSTPTLRPPVPATDDWDDEDTSLEDETSDKDDTSDDEMYRSSDDELALVERRVPANDSSTTNFGAAENNGRDYRFGDTNGSDYENCPPSVALNCEWRSRTETRPCTQVAEVYTDEERELLSILDSEIRLAENRALNSFANNNTEGGFTPVVSSTTELVRATKRIPKLIGGADFATPDEIQRTLMASFIRGHERGSFLSGFEVEIESAPFDDSSWILRIEGRPESVEAFRCSFKRWCDAKVWRHNFFILLAKGKRLEIDVDPSKTLGAHLMFFPECGSARAGILIHAVDEHGQLAQLLDTESLVCGAAVVAFDGQEWITLDDFSRKLEQSGGRSMRLELAVWGDVESPYPLSRSDTKQCHSEREHACSDSWSASDGDARKMEVVNASSEKMEISSYADSKTTDPALESTSMASNSFDSGSVFEGPPSPPQGDNSSLFGSYHHFVTKYTDIVRAEFKDSGSGIHVTRVLGWMWAGHKLLGRQSCSPSCPCVFQLAELLSTTKSNVGDNGYPVGVMTNFAGKFLSKLRDEYPTETPQELLSRLMKMWAKHRMTRAFGVECKDSCECVSGWQIVFRKGASGDEDSKRRDVADESGGLPDQRAGVSVPRRVPGAAGATSRSFKEYDVEFRADHPLGFFCTTDKSETGNATCKIISVAPNGQARSDCRIQPGSQVVAVSVNSAVHRVATCAELKDLYEQVAGESRSLTLTFINSHVVNTQSAKVDKEWRDNGTWRGKVKTGWAGGVEMELKSQRYDMHISQQPAQSPVAGVLPLASDACLGNAVEASFGALGGASEATLAEEWVSRVSMSTIFTSTTRLPILRREGNGGPSNGGRKEVTFSESSETRRFSSKAPANEFLVLSTDEVASTLTPPNELTTAEGAEDEVGALRWSIEVGSCKDTLAVLERGAFFGITSEAPLQEMRVSIATLLGGSLSKDDRLDLQNKDRLLNIYLNASVAIREVKSLKNWLVFEVLLTEIDNINVHHDSDELIQYQPFAVGLSTGGELMAAPPPEPLANRVVYNPAICYKMNYNSSITPDRMFDIRVMTVLPDGTTVRSLGAAAIPIAELYSKCSKDGRFWDGEFEVRGGDVSDGSSSPDTPIVVRVRARRSVVTSHVQDKKQAAVKIIKKVETWIRKFNTVSADGHLSANIRIGKFSLLHAAILLEDLDLVERLVALDANPWVKCKQVGSAFSYAMTMWDGHFEKSSGDETEGQDGNESEWRARRSRLEKIVAYLREVESKDSDEATSGVAVAESGSSNRRLESKLERQGEATLAEVAMSRPNGLQSEIAYLSLKLPILAQPYWVFGTNFRPHCLCRYLRFVCHNRFTTCKFVHVQPIWKKDFFEQTWQVSDQNLCMPAENFKANRKMNTCIVGRRKWFTAAYSTAKIKPECGQEVIFAQGGPEACVNEQGISWYRSKASAKEALRRSLIVAFHAASQPNPYRYYDPHAFTMPQTSGLDRNARKRGRFTSFDAADVSSPLPNGPNVHKRSRHTSLDALSS